MPINFRTKEQIRAQIEVCREYVSSYGKGCFYGHALEILEWALTAPKGFILARLNRLAIELGMDDKGSGEMLPDDVQLRAQGSALIWLLGNDLKGFLTF